MGYVFGKYSENYESAFREGKRCLSDVSKMFGISTHILRHLLSPCEWHHTGKYFNETWMYDLADPMLARSLNFARRNKQSLSFLEALIPDKEGWISELLDEHNDYKDEKEIINIIKEKSKEFEKREKVKNIKPVFCEELCITKNKYTVYFCLYTDGEARIGTAKTKKGGYWVRRKIEKIEEVETFLFRNVKYITNKKVKEILEKLRNP